MDNNSNTASRTEELLSQYAKAMGHPVRIMILEYLDKHPESYFNDISEVLPISKPTATQHLAALKNAGLVVSESEPPHVRYRIDAEAWHEAKKLFACFFSHAEVLPNEERDRYLQTHN